METMVTWPRQSWIKPCWNPLDPRGEFARNGGFLGIFNVEFAATHVREDVVEGGRTRRNRSKNVGNK